MKKIKCITAVILTMFLIAMVSGPVSAADTFKIGVLAPLSVDTGEGEVNAAQMAADLINGEGGINGKKLEIIIGDTEINPEKAISALKKMVLVDKVDAIVGGFSTGVTISLMEYLARFKVPYICTGSASDELQKMVKRDYDKYNYFFRLMYNETVTAEGMVDLVANYLAPELGIQRVAVVAEDAKWTKLVAQMFMDGVKAKGIDVVDYIRYPYKEIDFAPILSRIKNANVDFLVEICAIADGSILINQWADMQGPLIGGCDTSSGAADFWNKTNGRCLGEIVLTYGSYPVDVTPTTRSFWNDYTKRFGIIPRYASGYTYDAVFILANMFKEVGKAKLDVMVKFLENQSYLGGCPRIAEG